MTEKPADAEDILDADGAVVGFRRINPRVTTWSVQDGRIETDEAWPPEVTALTVESINRTTGGLIEIRKRTVGGTYDFYFNEVLISKSV